MTEEIKTQVVVIGGGPAGYSSAFRCADLGLKTVLVERYNNLGGVCLNVGCIPSKSLLHIAKNIEEIKKLQEQGISIGKLDIDIKKIATWKTKLIQTLTLGLMNMAKNRHVKIIHGMAKFNNPNSLEVTWNNNITNIIFDHAIIATGSQPTKLPWSSTSDGRVWNSTSALELTCIPKRLLIIGGGVIGLEMATVYHALGSNIDIVEMSPQIIPTADKDVIEIFNQSTKDKFNVMLETKIIKIEVKQENIGVIIENKTMQQKELYYDNILVSIGRTPNTKEINLHKLGIKINNNGFICVDNQMRTNIPNIYAIGDVVGPPMLAHKAIHEGHIAAEVISGLKHYFDPKVIPSIAYTEPEVAWVGMTEKEANIKNVNYEVSIFPWTASGRALSSNYKNGITKLIFDKNTRRLIGGAIVGTNGGELLGEISLAIEMGCDAEDIALTIHAHPTLYESIGLSAQIFDGTITDLYNKKANN